MKDLSKAMPFVGKFSTLTRTIFLRTYNRTLAWIDGFPLAYADPVAVILTANGHVAAVTLRSSLIDMEVDDNFPFGYYEFEDIVMHIEDNLTGLVSDPDGASSGFSMRCRRWTGIIWKH